METYPRQLEQGDHEMSQSGYQDTHLKTLPVIYAPIIKKYTLV